MSLEISPTSCRACLRDSVDSFFEMNKQCFFSQDHHNFCDVFNFCSHLKVKTNDGLPQRICFMCAQELQQTYVFLQRVLASDKKLNELKECDNEGIDTDYFQHNDYVKDPLENISDSEVNIEGNKSEIYEHNSKSSCTSLNNADNAVEAIHISKSLPSPHLTDSDDNSDCDFFKSVESQIFPKGRLKCKICSKAYFTDVGLKAHMVIHLPKDKSKSNDISKTPFNTSNYIKSTKILTSHISDDEDSDDNKDSKFLKQERNKIKFPKPKKMFPCQVCGKQLISASKLRYHMVMHTGEKDYLCAMCPKAYSTIYALKHHMRTHTGERPYECKFCGDRFLRPTTLKSHMRRHTGERPYGCDICGKRFIQHSSMATHMKLNHMDKTISCLYCEKKYARQTDLNTHLLSHSGDKPFACQFCSSRFTRQSNLNKHVNQHHNDANIGDKKFKKIIKQETNVSMNESNDFSIENVFEKPSCSSNLKIDFDSTSMITFQNVYSDSSLHQIATVTEEINHWNWTNQT